jgi:hypothetical protein
MHRIDGMTSKRCKKDLGESIVPTAFRQRSLEIAHSVLRMEPAG